MGEEELVDGLAEWRIFGECAIRCMLPFVRMAYIPRERFRGPIDSFFMVVSFAASLRPRLALFFSSVAV